MAEPLTQPHPIEYKTMNQTVAPRELSIAPLASVAKPGSRPATRMPTAAGTALRFLERLQHGRLTVHLPDGSVREFGAHAVSNTSHAMLHVRHWRVFAQAMKSGDIGFAESYIAGDWSTPDLTALLQLLATNRKALDEILYGTWWGRVAYRVKHLLNHNSRRNSRKNIHAHYDLGNSFYRLWLDETMNYSSALFEGDFSRSLATAQKAKVSRALQQCRVQAGQRLLEIGCGWGALAEAAVADIRATVVGVTLSQEQLSYAQNRLQNLTHQVIDAPATQTPVRPIAELRLQDYRDIVDAPFDAICSIEMVEAVGQAYWPGYFQTLARLLKPGARACIQTIVIDDALFDRYVQSTDFIQQYIFPGGCLPCPREFKGHAEQAGLVLDDSFAFGGDYAQTLRLWRSEFQRRKAEIAPLGFDNRFMRIWEFYLCYCEAAFEVGDINLVQYTLYKPVVGQPH